MSSMNERIEQSLAFQLSDAMRRVAEEHSVSLDRVMRVYKGMESAVTTRDEVHDQWNRGRRP
jgi:hypothetical protein